MATRRNGKPYLWVTHLAKLLAGDRCHWSAWFKANHRYEKFEQQATDLVQWSKDHTELMRAREHELRREGFACTLESENEFKLELPSIIIAGKPDILARKERIALVVDGKTGRERESDLHQVLIYLRVLPKCRPDLVGGYELEGEVQYKRNDQRITLTPAEWTAERVTACTDLLRIVSDRQPPKRVPSAHECRFCNIGPQDCPDRIRTEQPAAMAAEF